MGFDPSPFTSPEEALAALLLEEKVFAPFAHCWPHLLGTLDLRASTTALPKCCTPRQHVQGRQAPLCPFPGTGENAR